MLCDFLFPIFPFVIYWCAATNKRNRKANKAAEITERQRYPRTHTGFPNTGNVYIKLQQLSKSWRSKQHSKRIVSYETHSRWTDGIWTVKRRQTIHLVYVRRNFHLFFLLSVTSASARQFYYIVCSFQTRIADFFFSFLLFSLRVYCSNRSLIRD